MKDLFGVEVSDVDPPKVGGNRAIKRPFPTGMGPQGATCRSCRHCTAVEHHDKRYYKCAVVRDHWSHGPGTDVKLKDWACRSYDNTGASNAAKS